MLTVFCISMLLKVERRIDLVYGGGSVGLMGLISQAVHDGGRHVLGFALSLSLSLVRILSKKKEKFGKTISFLLINALVL